MALRVPEPEMLDEIPTRRIGAIILRIADRGTAEQTPPARVPMQRIGVLQHVARLVPKDAYAFRMGAALDVDDHLAFEPHQPRMRQIERKRNAGRVAGAEPFAGN